MPEGLSNGAPFVIGDAFTPDETGIGTTWAVTASGTLTSSTVWDQNVLVTGDVTVSAGVTLTIEPGVTVFFAAQSDDQAAGRWTDKAELIVWGTLLADGTPTSPIYFTSDATPAVPEDWGGIVIRKDSTQSVLNACLVQYAQQGVSFYSVDEGGGTLSGTVTHCTFQRNTSGLYLYGRPELNGGGGTITIDPVLAHNLIVSNTEGIVLRTTTGYGLSQNYAVVQDNILRGNETGMYLRANTWWEGHADNYPEIVNNTFIDNTTYNLDISASGSSDGSGSDTDVRPTVEHNLFDSAAVTTTTHIRLHLNPYGSDGTQILSPTIRYNTLRNAAAGILVEDTQSYDTLNPTISHNVFYGFNTGDYAIDNQTARTITATDNYWGQTEAAWDAGAPPAIIAGTVVVSPHLTSLSAPVVTRLTPGLAQPGDLVTLHGANFIDETPPVPPTLVTPTNGGAINDTTPTLDWKASPSPDVMGYRLDLDSTVIDIGAPTEYTTHVLAEGVYTWTVAAYDFAHHVSPYTDTWSFTVDTTPPSVPTLIAPTNGTYTTTNDLTLSWDASADAAGYLLDLNGAVSDVGNVLHYAPGVLPDGVHTWTVAAYDDAHNVSAYADAWTFEVDTTADLALSKIREGTGVVTSGLPITYVLTLTNHGSATPVSAVITDTFSSAGALAEIDAPGCTWTPGTAMVTCTCSDVESSTPHIITMIVTTTETYSGTLTNEAIVAPVGPIVDEATDNNETDPVSVIVRGETKSYIYLPLVTRQGG